MNVVWPKSALADLQSIYDYIALDNPIAAERIIERLFDVGDSLSKFPDKYRRGAAPNTREFVIPNLPYIMVYEIEPDQIRIISIFHGAQDKPRGPA